MAINPFRSLNTRSRMISPSNFLPFKVVNGIAIPNETIDAEVALTNSDIFSLVTRISADVAACDLKTDNMQLQNLYKKPSRLINGYGFWQTVMANLILNGNAFAVIHRDTKNVPYLLENIPISQIRITLLDSSIDLLYTVDYQDERGTQQVSSTNMLHFRLMSYNSNSANQYSGISPLQSLATEINVQNLSNKLTLSTLKNAINPSVILKSPAGLLSNEAREKIRTDFEGANNGDNTGRVLVMDQSLDMTTIQINADVAKFLQNTKLSQAEIAKAFCIDISYLDSSKGDQQSNIQQIRSLYASSLSTYMKPITSELEMKFDCSADLDVNSAIDIDGQQLIDNISKLSASANPVIPPEKALQILQERGVI